MSRKGTLQGECFTPDCTNRARWIPTAEGPVVDMPSEHYRCSRCCDLVGLAMPVRPSHVIHGTPEWEQWHAEALRVVALPLAELMAASGSVEMKINGCPVLAVAPKPQGGHVVVVQNGKETVLASMRYLTDAEWDLGTYYASPAEALLNFANRVAELYGAGEQVTNPNAAIVAAP